MKRISIFGSLQLLLNSQQKRLLAFGGPVGYESCFLLLGDNKKSVYWRFLTNERYSLRKNLSICVTCSKDSANHLFIHRELTSHLWSFLINKFGLGWRFPWSISELADSWRGGPFFGCGQILRRTIPFPIVWLIWKEWNNGISKNVYSTSQDLRAFIHARIAKWALLKREFYNLSMTDILFNWRGLLMGCGLSKEGRVVAWSNPQMGCWSLMLIGLLEGSRGRWVLMELYGMIGGPIHVFQRWCVCVWYTRIHFRGVVTHRGPKPWRFQFYLNERKQLACSLGVIFTHVIRSANTLADTLSNVLSLGGYSLVIFL